MGYWEVSPGQPGTLPLYQQTVARGHNEQGMAESKLWTASIPHRALQVGVERTSVCDAVTDSGADDWQRVP